MVDLAGLSVDLMGGADMFARVLINRSVRKFEPNVHQLELTFKPEFGQFQSQLWFHFNNHLDRVVLVHDKRWFIGLAQKITGIGIDLGNKAIDG